MPAIAMISETGGINFLHRHGHGGRRRDVRSLLSGRTQEDWIARPGLGRLAMKQSGLREPMPLWVWLAIGLLILAGLAYVTGYLMIEDVLKFFSR